MEEVHQPAHHIYVRESSFVSRVSAPEVAKRITPPHLRGDIRRRRGVHHRLEPDDTPILLESFPRDSSRTPPRGKKEIPRPCMIIKINYKHLVREKGGVPAGWNGTRGADDDDDEGGGAALDGGYRGDRRRGRFRVRCQRRRDRA